MRTPISPPQTFAIARVSPIFQSISPFAPKTRMAPALVATLTTLAIAEADRNAKPMTATKVRIKKEPVPGPMIPS